MRRSWIAITSLTAVALGTSSCGSRHLSTLDRARAAGIIRAAYAPEAPYAYRDSAGRVTGQAPELLRELTRRLGIPHVEFVQTEFALLIPMLQSGKVDVIASGMFITPRRATLVAFSDPTLSVYENLLVPRGNPRHLTSYASVARDTTVHLAVLAGSVEEATARADGVAASRLLIAPDVRTANAAFTAGQVDALAISAPTARRAAAGLQADVVPLPGGRSSAAFAVRQDDRHFLAALDSTLRIVLAAPAYAGFVGRFGFLPDEVPGAADSTP
ncbi:MAG TPA: transporter substrate-binding domain-containing protein [Gemmatimonadales bacterium]|nr:transporter substrate-binding domain-containing protein [Gemmatimonadales bacterium]